MRNQSTAYSFCEYALGIVILQRIQIMFGAWQNRYNRRSDRSQQGFTLVELLMAITLIAVAAITVMINMPPANQSAKHEAMRFAARLKSAMSESLVSGEPMGLDLAQLEYEFLRQRDGDWVRASDARYALWQLRDGVQLRYDAFTAEIDLSANDKALRGFGVSLSEDDEDRKIAPLIQFQPLGAETELRVIFAQTDPTIPARRRQDWIVHLKPDGLIEVSRGT